MSAAHTAVDERALFFATFGAAYMRELAAYEAVHRKQPDAAKRRTLAHVAIGIARGAIQGLRDLGEGAVTL